MDDTWEWGVFGAPTCSHAGIPCWRQANPADRPQGRVGHSMTYDWANGYVLMFGGTRNSACDGGTAWQCAGTWKFDGIAWTRLYPARAPSPRYNAIMAYDSTRGRVVLHGGGQFGASYGDTWEWDGTTPGYTNWNIGEPNGWGGDEDCVHVTYNFRWNDLSCWTYLPSVCEEEGNAGAQMLVWQNQIGWASMGSTSAGPGAPGQVSLATSSGPEIPRWFFGPRREVAIAVAPVQANGRDTGGAIAADYVEVGVKYYKGALLGWDWEGLGWEGWGLVNITNATSAGGVLTLTLGAGDPQALSPTFSARAADYQNLRVSVRNATAASDMQLFWSRTDAAGFDEARSRTFSAPNDGRWRVVIVPLAGHPEWTGVITRLRLDPPNAPGAAALDVDWVRLTD